MDDLGFNKIAGAVLATGLGMLLLMKLPGLFMAHAGEEIAYKVGPIEVPGEGDAPIDLPFPQQSWVDGWTRPKAQKFSINVSLAIISNQAAGTAQDQPFTALLGMILRQLKALSFQAQ